MKEKKSEKDKKETKPRLLTSSAADPEAVREAELRSIDDYPAEFFERSKPRSRPKRP